MASIRCVFALGIVCACLLSLTVVDTLRGESQQAPSARLVPEWDRSKLETISLARTSQTTKLRWDRATRRLELVEPFAAPVSQVQADELLGAIELMSAVRCTRAGTGRGLEEPRAQVALTLTQGQRVELAVGAFDPTTERVWLRRRGQAVDCLVDRALAEALLVSPDVLRARQPFATLGTIESLSLRVGADELRLAGSPLQVVYDRGLVRADPHKVAGLVRQLTELSMTRFSSERVTRPELTVVIDSGGHKHVFEVGGPCEPADSERVVSGSTRSSTGRWPETRPSGPQPNGFCLPSTPSRFTPSARSTNWSIGSDSTGLR